MTTATELNATARKARANAAKTPQVAQPGKVASTPLPTPQKRRGGTKAQAATAFVGPLLPAPAAPAPAAPAPALPTLAQQAVAAAPAPAPKAVRTRTANAAMVALTAKGNMYNPNEKARVRGQQNVETWATLKGALAAGPVSITALQALVPTHKDFIGYALRSGWIALA